MNYDKKCRQINGIGSKILKFKCYFMQDAVKRAKDLKSKNIFAFFGENNYIANRTLPTEPYLVKIHNNVKIAARVSFITHDIMNDMFAEKDGLVLGKDLSYYKMGTIEIFDNVAIGSDSVILYNVKIGPNALVAAGSVVTKDVPEGAVVGGNPARVIGSLDKLIEKRKNEKDIPTNRDPFDKIMSYFWDGNEE